MFVPCDDRTEAHFICGLLNSCVANFVARSYSTGKSFASAHLLHHVRLPKFDAIDKRHQRLAELSARAHQLAAETTEVPEKRLPEVEAEIDEQAAAVWDITSTELRDIQSSLADLR
jgi:Xaa-Pro aminopeptidase